MTLTPETEAEHHLVTCLKAGEPCVFEGAPLLLDRQAEETIEAWHRRVDAALAVEGPEARSLRTLRADFLGAILRREALELAGEETTLPLPRTIEVLGAYIAGRLDIARSHIAAKLSLSACQFPQGISGEDVKITSDLFLNRARLSGPANFSGGKIGGQLSANDTIFDIPDGMALNCQATTITRGVFLRRARLSGEAAFDWVEIGGQLSANDAVFDTADGIALSCQAAMITGDVFLFRAHLSGQVAFNRAKIGGQFTAEAASFINANPQNRGGHALWLQGVVIKDELVLYHLSHAPVGGVALNDAGIDTIVIDESFWPLGPVGQRGLSYKRLIYRGSVPPDKAWQGWLSPPPMTSMRRNLVETARAHAFSAVSAANNGQLSTQEFQLADWHYGLTDGQGEFKWPSRSFTPQPWLQYIKVLAAEGNERKARKVKIEMERHMSRETFDENRGNPFIRHIIYRPWRVFFRLIAGYGTEAWKAIIGLFGVWLLGFGVFASHSANMVPAQERFYLDRSSLGEITFGSPDSAPHIYDLYVKDKILPENYPPFDPLIYSADVMLPFVNFAQETHWRPKNIDNKNNWLRWYNRTHLVLGWLLSTIGLLWFTGLIREREE